jgi:hypothetical protein
MKTHLDCLTADVKDRLAKIKCIIPTYRYEWSLMPYRYGQEKSPMLGIRSLRLHCHDVFQSLTDVTWVWTKFSTWLWRFSGG